MSRQAWQLIKDSKRFYVNTYRKTGIILFWSICLNLLLGFSIAYSYFNMPPTYFYATSGITPPIELTPLDSPNYTSTPLLANDPEGEDENRAIPQ